jgi:transcription-repair coupling factor (superfamily II helicase)
MAERRAVLAVKKNQQNGKRTLADAVGEVAESSALREAIYSLAEEKRVTLDSVWTGALAPIAAGWYRADPRSFIVLCAQVAEAETIAAELSELLGQRVEVFPPGSEETELESLQHQETAQRLHVLSWLYNACHRNPTHAGARAKPNGQSDIGSHLSKPPIVVTTLPALLHSVPSPKSLEGDKQILSSGRRIDLAGLKQWLVKAGYHATGSVQLPGEFAMRGGILDIYPPDETLPVRVELFDDEIESLRTFDIATQRSIEQRDSLELLAVQGSVAQDGSLLDYLGNDTLVFVHEQRSIVAAAEAFLHRVPFPERYASPQSVWQRLAEFPVVYSSQLSEEGYLGKLVRMPLGTVERIGGDLERLAQDIDQHAGARPTIVVALNDGERDRLKELLATSTATEDGRLNIVVSQLQNGFEILPNGTLVLTAGQLLRRSHVRRVAKRTKSRPIDSFLELRTGDLVVHLSHGIGVYRGTTFIDKHGQMFEHLELEFDGGTKIFVPSSKIELVQRYLGGTKSRPKLAKIGGQTWAKQKRAAQDAVQDMAVDLLELQARRGSQPGILFAEDSIWQNQFDASFSYVETPDQLKAIAAVKSDMTSSRPMDRLICGDVGFGKTEVAMRAAFKAIDSGYQVAVLVPTTVLAEQHYKTFRERMAEFPFDIEKLSRFASTRQQKETIRGIHSGRVDIVVGTHRLASKDLKFHNLGLLIIDEEQRFGVEIKERLKHMRANVDVLTLSATPIPRTLHMSLVGVRDISNLETPPEDRLSVETRLVRFDENIIRNAILRELNRGGQIFFVHNRIEDIKETAAKIKRICPDVTIGIGHGQMEEGELEQVMIDFIEHRFDILISTTIIESGLDIPNANTIFIDEAYRYGLSELHQLRGRVGRYKHQAYCYLLVDRHKHLTPDAARRLHAIEEYSQIGAGFGIAMRDLEIRGAGNLLGTQQSGHIAAIGYELYCQLLGNAVRELTHQAPKLSVEVDIDIPMIGTLPIDYVPELRQRIDIYRRISRLSEIGEIDDMKDELADRFGRLPPEVECLFEVAELKIDASLWFVKALQAQDNYLVLTYANRQRIEHLAKLHDRRLRIVDSQKAYWITQPNKKGEINWIREAQTAFRSSK